MLATWEIRDKRPAAGGHQDCAHSIGFAVNGHLLRPNYGSAAVEQISATVIDQGLINTVETLNFGGFIISQSWPVKRWLLGLIPAKAFTSMK